MIHFHFLLAYLTSQEKCTRNRRRRLLLNPSSHKIALLPNHHVTPTHSYAYNNSQDLPTPFCKEARLTYVRMHERVQRTFSFVVSSPGGVAEAIFKVNFTMRHKTMSNSVDDADEEELSEPEEIHFPVFGSSQNPIIVRPLASLLLPALILPALLLLIRSSPVQGMVWMA